MDGTWLKVIELGVVVKKVVKRHGRQEGRKEVIITSYKKMI